MHERPVGQGKAHWVVAAAATRPAPALASAGGQHYHHATTSAATHMRPTRLGWPRRRG